MGFLTVHRICKTQAGPAPTRPALCEMLIELTRACAELGQRPVRILKSESWKCRPQDGEGWLLARLRIECEPGEPSRPILSWYQWQHPSWAWSVATLPTVDCSSVERTHVEVRPRVMLVGQSEPPRPGVSP